ncbi:MAG TPA: threonine/serine dehydratase [Thermomicrobiales bacterium]|jgi:threonine dehydratase|nr:threonine/serine dehydratase [Thermomicrobiales bacterium]
MSYGSPPDWPTSRTGDVRKVSTRVDGIPHGDVSPEPAASGGQPAAALDGCPVTLEDLLAARERIAPYIHRTPLLSSRMLGSMSDTDLWLKAEVLQRTGSFKIRGALNSVLQLTPEQRARGIIAFSAGNHGQGVAQAAGLVGARCVIFSPETAPALKVAAMRGYGAEVRFAPSMAEIEALMDAYRQEYGLHYIHPFGDHATIAGQGTLGLELVEDLPDVETVVTGVGGGGLLAGIAVAIRALRPECRVVGVEPEGAPTVYAALRAGGPVPLPRIATLADGLAAARTAPLTYQIIRQLVDDVVLVTEEQIRHALVTILQRAKLVAEPAGVAGVAAVLAGAAGTRPGSKVIAVLSGGNVDLTTLKRLL